MAQDLVHRTQDLVWDPPKVYLTILLLYSKTLHRLAVDCLIALLAAPSIVQQQHQERRTLLQRSLPVSGGAECLCSTLFRYLQ